MKQTEKPIAFLCAKGKCIEDKLAYKIVRHLADSGEVEMGDLTTMHQDLPTMKNFMIFINDCKASCVKLFTNGLDSSNYLYIDVSPFTKQSDFSIAEYAENEILSKIQRQAVQA